MTWRTTRRFSERAVKFGLRSLAFSQLVCSRLRVDRGSPSASSRSLPTLYLIWAYRGGGTTMHVVLIDPDRVFSFGDGVLLVGADARARGAVVEPVFFGH